MAEMETFMSSQKTLHLHEHPQTVNVREACPKCSDTDTYARGLGLFCRKCNHVWLVDADLYQSTEPVPTKIYGAYVDVGVRCGACHRMIGLDELTNQSRNTTNAKCLHCGHLFQNWESIQKHADEFYVARD